MNQKHLFALVCAAFSLLAVGGCKKSSAAPEKCGTLATVRDLTGLDGCGLVLELQNGQVLEPTGPVWQGFRATAGQAVKVGYVPTNNASNCMVGPVVEIKCIEARGN